MLADYIAIENRYRTLVGMPLVDLTNRNDLLSLVKLLDESVLPENLMADGQNDEAQINRKFDYLCAIATELHWIDPTLQFRNFDISFGD